MRIKKEYLSFIREREMPRHDFCHPLLTTHTRVAPARRYGRAYAQAVTIPKPDLHLPHPLHAPTPSPPQGLIFLLQPHPPHLRDKETETHNADPRPAFQVRRNDSRRYRTTALHARPPCSYRPQTFPRQPAVFCQSRICSFSLFRRDHRHRGYLRPRA